jgi:hypothetical protein
LAANEFEPDAEGAFLRPYVTMTMTDGIGELGMQGASLADLTGVSEQGSARIRGKIQNQLAGQGIILTDLKIEAIENIE